MQIQRLTIGTGVTEVTFDHVPSLGVKLLGRDANTGNTFLGTGSGVTITTGVLVPKGAAGSVDPFVVPPEHFQAYGRLFLVADAATQIIDVVSQ